jgi:hypothetical protein
MFLIALAGIWAAIQFVAIGLFLAILFSVCKQKE